jgi:hypothetical protein
VSVEYRNSALYLIFLHFLLVDQFFHVSSQSWGSNGLIRIRCRYGSFHIRPVGTVGRTYSHARTYDQKDLTLNLSMVNKIVQVQDASVILRPFKKIPLFPQFLADVNIVLNFQCKHIK